MNLEDLLRVKDNTSEYGDDEYYEHEFQTNKSKSYDKVKFQTQTLVSV
jgi:hypothetical protein